MHRAVKGSNSLNWALSFVDKGGFWLTQPHGCSYLKEESFQPRESMDTVAYFDKWSGHDR
ncbi:MAG: hypothetical protein ACI9UK_001121 [Candidatus Krumholzibacteriia bacterium]|jgi:hypothetical protein